MKNTLLIILLIIAFKANAQKCKLEEPETNPITNETTVKTQNILFGVEKGKPNGIGVKYAIIKTESSLDFSFTLVSSSSLKVEKGAGLEIKFEDNSVIKLQASNEGTGNTINDLKYKIPQDVMVTLRTKLISSLQFALQDKDGKTIYTNISPYGKGESEDLIFQLKCVLSN